MIKLNDEIVPSTLLSWQETGDIIKHFNFFEKFLKLIKNPAKYNTVKPAYTTTSIRRPLVLRRPMLNLPKPFSIQPLLLKTTTCLMRPASTFIVPKMKKKNCLKQPLQNLIQRRKGKQCIKKYLSNYIYSIANL